MPTTPFLDPGVIESGLAGIARIAQTERVPVALVGGVALNLFGSRRLTVDIDVISHRFPAGLRQGDPLTIGGASTEIGGAPVDWIVRDDDYQSVYLRALRDAVCVPGVPIPVATPVDLAVMKLIAAREKDELDLCALITSGRLDVKAAKKRVLALLGRYAADSFARLVDEAEWRASREG